jgi:hypothetical protein
MSADSWLEAAKIEEGRLLAEIAKTTLYKQLVAVRAVIALYDGTPAPATTPEQLGATVPAMRTSGQASRHTFKTANAFTDLADAAAEGSPRPNHNGHR